MNTHTLRVVWPILDDAMFDDEAIVEAWLQWPRFPEQYQVTVVDNPRMQVIRLDGHRKRAFQTDRAVICEAPVIQRTSGKDSTMTPACKVAA